MNRQQMLAAAATAHTEWLDEHADSIPAVPADSSPHDGQQSDYAEHHADRSAPADLDDLLSANLIGLIRQGQPPLGVLDRQLDADFGLAGRSAARPAIPRKRAPAQPGPKPATPGDSEFYQF